jgi:hypothetical protein
VSDSPFDALVGHELDTVSFVRDYVELRYDDREGPEALHFMPADSKGQVDPATMSIW